MKRKSSGKKRNKSQGVIGFLFRTAWKALPFVLILTVLASAWIGAKQLLYADPYFQISAITIFPRGVLSQTEYERLETTCRSQNLLEINLDQINRIVRSNPNVKDARILRKLPNEIEISLISRNPVAQLQLMPNGHWYLLDEEGIVMEVLKAAKSEFLMLTQYDYQTNKLALFDRYRDESLPRILKFLEIFKQNSVSKNEQIDSIAIRQNDMYSIFLHKGPELRMCGNLSLGFEKIDAIEPLLKGPERFGLSYVNLCLDDVVVQEKG
ncbi:MAG: hypothetical protein COV74_05330 [Candidatus Omnitrophica bacterium CG11_big_fil_rev_8_21_14_0_20_45_26]|uniref:POTRA domain-containing protein n=1 Tax=Candidatus Abzuiibacterium crystallinum TaxID=1974748 RepID=A0A2H0LPJ7_9BACT|nr:MAG: hypothetical protein COV74_05330 [Candidatus Omnitrophica bacterium CG11_big_fil_rev_8_21_14_0_20_45_26]PIW64313.1 MAG: hypothetical protein COW12_06650 [Candidatus Omnitrophica bacterium CG12_big_fil_rev_8_21_14_0_65_45_16]